HGELDQAALEGRPAVEDVLRRFSCAESERVAERREREHESRPESEWRSHVSAATACESGAREKWTPAARAASSSLRSSPTCSARAGSTCSWARARRIPSGAGFFAAGTTAAKKPVKQ